MQWRSVREGSWVVAARGYQGLGGECIEPPAEAGAMFRKHGDEFNTHANSGSGTTHHGASANLTRGRIHQQLDGSSGGRGILRSNEETPQAEVSDIGEEFFLG